MRIKRVLQGTALTALAAAAWVGAGTVDASAAELNSSDIDIDYYDQQMYVDAPGDTTEILFGVGTLNKSGAVKISAWDVYEGSWASIDLSKLSNVKDNYVAVKTESSDPIYIKIEAAPKSQKLAYNSYTNKLTIENIKILKATETDAAKFRWEYRTPYGEWQGVYGYDEDTGSIINYDKEKAIFSQYQAQGASLYVRAAATGGSLTATSDKVKDAALKDASPEYSLYSAGSLPGKETKLNIPKQANGPSVKADYKKGIVTIPKGAEYRLLAQTEQGSDVYSFVNAVSGSATSEAKKYSVENIFKDANVTSAGAFGVVEVRKTGSESGKKGKAPSKWSRVDIQLTTKAAGFAAETVIATSQSAISTDGSSVKLTGYKNSKVTIKNNSTVNYEVSTDNGETFKAMNAGKSLNIGASKDTVISIRTAGSKATKNTTAQWPGQWTEAGKIGF